MSLKTDNPIALQALMSEYLFTTGYAVSEMSSLSPAAPLSPTSTTIPPLAAAAATEEFIYQGDKARGILFLLRYPSYPYFSPAAEEAFVKTIAAMQLSPDTVAVMNLANAHNANDFKRIMAFFAPQKIILLGVEPATLNLPSIALNAYMKGRVATVFNTFSFEEMFADVQKKKLFWNEFKSFLSA